jgi:hypothetical protein
VLGPALAVQLVAPVYEAEARVELADPGIDLAEEDPLLEVFGSQNGLSIKERPFCPPAANRR